MKKTILTPTVLTALATSFVGLCINLTVNNQHVRYKWSILAGYIIWETIILTIIGAIFLLKNESSPIAQGIFIGLGLNLVIGFSVCTML
jgi:hypothetical protein